MRTNLSPAFVARAKAEAGAERSIYWDAGLRGFGLQVTKAGHKSFVCQYAPMVEAAALRLRRR